MKGKNLVEKVGYTKESSTSFEMACFFKQVGANMCEYRKRKKWTQAQTAKALDMAFISYNKIERGAIGTTLRTLFRIAKVLGVSPVQLLLDKDEIFLTKKEIAHLYPKGEK